MTSALNSRFLLALHEMKARLEGVADSSISSFSLNTGSGDNPREGSPELPDFLGIIGSSIRSIHDDDEDLQSLEFAPPQLEEHHSEPEEEVLESGTDGDLV
ncbi:hypothetical protein TRAPUB_5356 [Trametes pubescens]|uniref:Uncharacterized protein n=1 Tax=Trametes pubescens TaxID=154538 RepID=A0A1M2V8T1_TRAPU|nr:hypothetical protein TRAPUB_5356 [Trametes pubescens]